MARAGLAGAKLLAFAVPAALLAGAYGSQHIGGLAPCEMCYWQRWAHWTALAFAAAAFAAGQHSRPRVEQQLALQRFGKLANLRASQCHLAPTRSDRGDIGYRPGEEQLKQKM